MTKIINAELNSDLAEQIVATITPVHLTAERRRKDPQKRISFYRVQVVLPTSDILAHAQFISEVATSEESLITHRPILISDARKSLHTILGSLVQSISYEIVDMVSE